MTVFALIPPLTLLEWGSVSQFEANPNVGVLKRHTYRLGRTVQNIPGREVILPSYLWVVPSPPPHCVLMAFTELIPLSRKGPAVVVRSTPVKLQRFRVPSV